MLFNSFHFLLFFIFVVSIYWFCPRKVRWLLLLVASCYFYMAFIPVYILILFFTIVVDYFAGILIEGSAGVRRKLYLVMSLVANIGVLSIFKYYNFIAENLNGLGARIHERTVELTALPQYRFSRPALVQNPNGGEQKRRPAGR